MREWIHQTGVERECFINEKFADNGLKTFPECAANRAIRCVKGGANESEKLMFSVCGVRVFICFNYYVGAEVLFFTAHFDARAVSDPVGIFTNESNSSGSSEEMHVDAVSDAVVQGIPMPGAE
ncbi:hypothetical protein [Burkholderia lata]|uniref:hypothetical protein n=1 Tax=Burkholderia lata (strain ATCC 17760 / DSM 23089 / LMG 22485 / NCIMB 9086 / R18194 / 383) TaxID=482957 RepID=UPI001583826F|nr:hypothetical protein [Burkholderia lata]